MTKKVRSQGKCVNWSPIDISWMMRSGCSQEPFPLKHCIFYTVWVYLLCLHNMGTVAVETERCIIRLGMTDTPPPAGVLSTTTHPSDPRGRSFGTQAGKWVLLLVCDLSALFHHSSLRISEHSSFCHLWFREEFRLLLFCDDAKYTSWKSCFFASFFTGFM